MSPELKELVGDTKLTPSQLLLLEKLKDGKRHCRHDLRKILETEDFVEELRASSLKLLPSLITNVRPKLPKNHAIVCEYWMGGYYYRWIVLLTSNTYERSPNKGRPKKLGNSTN